MMVPLLFAPLLVFIFLFSLAPVHGALRQTDQLRSLIKSQSLSKMAFDAGLEFAAANGLSTPVFIGRHEGKMEGDRIEKLPGQPVGVDFDQYGGYVTVDPKAGRELFYYFVESDHDKDKKPLILWLNGGPGCSSLGFGAMEELGPFRVGSDGKTLFRNNYSWNNVANVLFLESPAGVGFSYSNKSSDYDKNGDRRTADDSYIFLINWLERFPHYKNVELFITGESYAGHYVPQLAYTILQNNKIFNTTNIKLRGIAVGNPYVYEDIGNKAEIDFLWGHSMISDETYAKILKNCNFSNPNQSTECINAIDSASSETGDIDDYNIYAPICPSDFLLNLDTTDGLGGDFDPCTDNYVTSYLNNPAVQKALHAKAGEWSGCSLLHWRDGPATMLSTFKDLISSGLYIWLYSGDVDSVVPITNTKNFIKMLKLPILKQWRAWYLNKEVGGYVVQYEGLTFVTVRGAGHEVPSYQPKRALEMISSFLLGKLPPSLEAK
ncbi:hypothetical protein M5K25_018357 [Dendrobium thyrsiflorum]|uniref:Carboxypeptidase n=1 Tax=Dendrobium thyrsiflorum TaxID=117978 RepID=A0ABD0UHP8_DENTH